MTKAYIAGISYYLPKNTLTNADLINEFPEWTIDKVAKKVGVNSRHIANNNETATDLAEQAALKLFEEYNILPQSIDFVLLCTQSPDYFLPTSACILQNRLNIPTTAGALDFNLGCSGYIYGLAIAKGLIAAGIAQNILLLTAETYSKYLHPKDKSNRSIFGDGAAASLISTKGIAEIGEFTLGTDGSGFEHLIVKSGGAKFPNKNNTSFHDTDGRIHYEDNLYMNGEAVFNFTLDVVPLILTQVLEKNKLQKEDIDYYVFHQANQFMLNTIRKICLLPKDKFYVDLSQTGNTVSSTIPIALKNCITNQIITNKKNILLAGFGVGLSWSGVLLKFV